jgi:KDO2-lipid IV(A) lauroyltransferase
MAAFVYYLFLPLIYLISILPFKILYGVSDLLCLLLFRVFKYRKQIVLTNLKNAFPDKSDAEINQTCRDFYQYFCDLILETIKTLTVGDRALQKHIRVKDMDVLDTYFRKGQSLILVLGHFGSWELAGARYSLEVRKKQNIHPLIVIYHPLKNVHFNRLLYYMRTHHGTGLYKGKEALKNMEADQGKLTVTAFIADQTPSRTHNVYWTSFLNQDTPVYFGTEVAAKRFDYPVVYFYIKRIKRGQYEMSAELLVKHPRDTKEGEITEIHTRRLEKDIIAQPEIWLWTHRRWKHKRP